MKIQYLSLIALFFASATLANFQPSSSLTPAEIGEITGGTAGGAAVVGAGGLLTAGAARTAAQIARLGKLGEGTSISFGDQTITGTAAGEITTVPYNVTIRGVRSQVQNILGIGEDTIESF